MTTYLSLDVLEAAPNARDPQEDAFHRSVAGLDPGLGSRWFRGRDSVPKVARTFVWTCANRSEIVALKAFLDARKGQAIPFWLPSRRRDLILAQAAGASDPGISIQAMGYTRFLFPAKARRHLAFRVGAAWIFRSVTDAAEGPLTETLTLSSAAGAVLPLDTLVSQLLLCRLAADEVGISYLTDSVAEAHIPYVEIPQEAP
jgi:hypothetical protein